MSELCCLLRRSMAMAHKPDPNKSRLVDSDIELLATLVDASSRTSERPVNEEPPNEKAAKMMTIPAASLLRMSTLPVERPIRVQEQHLSPRNCKSLKTKAIYDHRWSGVAPKSDFCLRRVVVLRAFTIVTDVAPICRHPGRGLTRVSRC